eukprot:5026961-Prorocentrum_lima.AAC.1
MVLGEEYGGARSMAGGRWLQSIVGGEVVLGEGYGGARSNAGRRWLAKSMVGGGYGARWWGE